MAMPSLFRASLSREIRDWEEEQLISAEQAAQLRARYGLSVDDRAASLGYMVLSGLAILCAGLALLLVISHNWDEIPRVVRMGALILLTAGLNLRGVQQVARGLRDSGVRWLFAGGLAYGASIMLIAQIYHLGEHFPDGLFWWALGVLPLALLCGSRLLHLLQLGLATLWLLTQAEYGLAWSYPLFLAATGWQLMRLPPLRALLALWLFGLFAWTQLAFSHWLGKHWLWSMDAAHLVVHTGLALVLFTVTQRLATHADSHWREAGAWLQHWLVRAAVGAMLLFSFADTWDYYITHMHKVGAPALILFLLADLVLVWLARALSPTRLVTLVLVAGTANVIVLGGFLLPDSDTIHVLMAVLVNLFLLALGIRLIVRGLEIRVGELFYSGVVLLLLLALMRYLNLIGDYLGSALLFLVAGGVLFAAARYWQRSASARLEKEDVA